jgi:hypothetical protein
MRSNAAFICARPVSLADCHEAPRAASGGSGEARRFGAPRSSAVIAGGGGNGAWRHVPTAAHEQDDRDAGMTETPETWFFEVILLELVNIPVKVIERSGVPRLAATRDFAREMFLQRYFDETYTVKHRRLKPQGVRIMNSQNIEVLRFTEADFYKEAGLRP